MKHTILTIVILLGLTTAGESQVAVIAHKSVPADTLEKSQLLDFYTGDIRFWNNDEAVVVLDLKPRSDVKKAFYKYLGKRSSRMKSIWLKKMLSGEGDPPKAMKTEEEVLEKVISTPGAIGFLSSERIKNKDVKILLVIPVSD